MRRDHDHFYTYPEHIHGLRGVIARLLYRLGYDYLTPRQRLAQVRIEATYWRNKADTMEIRAIRAARILSIVSDLDRCPHGRHEQDNCSMCQAEGYEWNQGNLYLTPGTRVGTDLSGDPIVYPGPNADRDPGAWRGGKP